MLVRCIRARFKEETGWLRNDSPSLVRDGFFFENCESCFAAEQFVIIFSGKALRAKPPLQTNRGNQKNIIGG